MYVAYDISVFDKLFDANVCLDMNFKTFKEAKEYAISEFSSHYYKNVIFHIDGMIDEKNLKRLASFKIYKRNGKVFIKQL